MHIDPVALERHRRFGAAMADEHYAGYPSAVFTVAVVLEVMTEAMADVAADAGIGSMALTPYVRAATSGFLREWRRLNREKLRTMQ